MPGPAGWLRRGWTHPIELHRLPGGAVAGEGGDARGRCGGGGARVKEWSGSVRVALGSGGPGGGRRRDPPWSLATKVSGEGEK
jgi:hypothetical protein